MSKENKYTNKLINESSPYLLQHAHNPVNWHAWNKETLEKAKKQNKAILVSIGYSTCHWCHVMEHEAFEDKEVADIMNHHFICIKVDREEHPDVDKYYMDAVNLITGRGGWPLNAVALPDGRPVWGGTYFPKENWKKILIEISRVIVEEPLRAGEYADNIENRIKIAHKIESNNYTEIELDTIRESITQLSKHFDYEWGGLNSAPKFPQPNNYRFLLNYLWIEYDDRLSDFLKNTLKRIALGGIHDWVGGGFARYSVDKYWKVPHFEKMLYDNGQLMRLFSEAYKFYKDPVYKNAVYSIDEFISDEMLNDEGGFYSAMDADSEGVEGKYYIWESEELRSLLGDDYNLFSEFFNIEEKGNWEHQSNVLISLYSPEEFAYEKGIDPGNFAGKLNSWKAKLKEFRSNRVKPSKDTKTIVSWNSLMSLGYLEAYKAFNDKNFLEKAKNNVDFIIENAFDNDNKLNRTVQNGHAKIDAYLDDYAIFTECLIELYQVSGDENYLNKATELSEKIFSEFYSKDEKLFYFSSNSNEYSLNRTFETEDNVIPASNSVMAQNLFKLGRILYRDKYMEISSVMLSHFSEKIVHYPFGFSNWAILKLWENNYSELAVLGKGSEDIFRKIQLEYNPNILVAYSETESEVPILKDRIIENKTLIYKCSGKSCGLPVENIEELEL